MIRLTQLAVSKRSVTLLLAIALFIGGVVSWGRLNQELLPAVQLPIVIVVTPVPGAGATDVASQVTQPIERTVGTVARLEHVSSSSVNSVSIVVGQFKYGTDVKATKATIEQAVQGLTLPSGAEPKVQTLDISALPPVTVAIRATGSTTQDQLNAFTKSTIMPALQGLDGVSAVDMTGGIERRVLLQLDPDKLAAAGVTLTQIQGVLQANNITAPAGALPVGQVGVPVSAQHAFTSVDELKALVVGVKMPAATGPQTDPATPPTPITLGSLGDVSLVDVQPTGYAQLDNEPSLVLTVSKSTDANTVSVADTVQSKLAELEKANSSTFKVTTVEDLSTFIKESRDGLVREGGLGALFAILTIFVFLLSLRSTLVAAVSIPLSIMTALVLMFVAGISINIMTLGGLAVAVGRVVDDAIVVLENIYRHRGRGDPMKESVISGTREVASAITSSTLTTVAVFLPLGFIGGIVSQVFLPFALTVTFALLSSLLCALTVVPVLASLFIDRIKLNPDEGAQHHDTIVQRIYTPILRFALRSRATRWGVVGIAMFLFVASFALIPGIPTQFLNAGSDKYLQITIAPPSGTPSQVVLEKAKAVQAAIRGNDEVNLLQTTVPGDGDTGLAGLQAAFTGRPANSATVIARLDKSVNLDAEQRKFTDQLKAVQSDGWSVEVAQQSMTGTGALSVIVSGSDAKDVQAGSQAVLASLKEMPDLINVKSDLATETPEIQVVVDPNKAIMAGTTTAQVQAEVRTALVGQAIGTAVLQTGPTPIYARVASPGLSSVDALKAMKVGTARVPLAGIATVEQAPAQARISRVDQAPAATISADSTNKDTGSISAAIQKRLDDLKAQGKLNGVTATLSGVTEEMNSAFSDLFLSMGVAVLLVYLVMVLVFDSLIDPLVIMFSLPLATIGAFPALFVTGRAIGVSSLIGFLMLIGIVVTNAIVLLDLVEQHRRRGMPMYDALVAGGRTRVRPILMTAIATMLALSPLGLGLNEGEIIASELATVVIGGLFSSTFLTLIVVPVVYSLVEGGKVSVRRRLGMRGEHEEEPQPQPQPVG